MSCKTPSSKFVITDVGILYAVLAHLDQRDQAQLSLVCKQAWLLVASYMWKAPNLRTIKQLQLFSHSVSVALPLELVDYKCYGDFLHCLDLSNIADRRDTIAYAILAPIFKNCLRLKTLNMSGSQKLSDIQFESLFANNTMLCSSLTSVNFSETYFLATHLSRVLMLLSGVRKLVLNESTTDDGVLVAISLSMPDLEWLEIERCGVSDVGIGALVMEYPKLAYLNTELCDGVLDTHLVQQISSGVWQEVVVYPTVYDSHHRVSNDDYDDGYECYDDFGAYDGKFYEYNYDKDDPDYYMDLERDFGRCNSYNEY